MADAPVSCVRPPGKVHGVYPGLSAAGRVCWETLTGVRQSVSKRGSDCVHPRKNRTGMHTGQGWDLYITISKCFQRQTSLLIGHPYSCPWATLQVPLRTSQRQICSCNTFIHSYSTRKPAQLYKAAFNSFFFFFSSLLPN